MTVITLDSKTEEARAVKAAQRIRQRWNAGPSEVKRYDGATSDRSNADWLTSQTTADTELQEGLPFLRDRAQDLERNNPYVERYLTELEANVLGSEGMTLQMQCKQPDGTLDKRDNKTVEDSWYEFNKRGNFDVTGEISGHEGDKLTLRGAARDGNSFIRIHRGWNNRWGIAFQLLESTWLDHTYSTILPDGNEVRMGVERDAYGRKVAYWFVGTRPGERINGWSSRHTERVRIPADQIIHVMRRKRVDQSLGEPWISCVINTLRNIDKYEEAEVLAARAEACKGGFFYSDLVSDTLPISAVPDPANGNLVQDLSPNQLEALPYGVKFQQYNPTHPNGNHSAFRKDNLRKAASGLGVSYNMLANDLEGVNYSSLRGGLLDERELYMMLQRWYIETVKTRIFEEWLEAAMLSGELKFPFYKFEKFNAPHFQGRRWPWVDPLKDVQAAKEAIALKLTSRRSIIAKSGEYIEDVLMENKMDEDLANEIGVPISSSADAIRQMADAYGVATRAGVVTPNATDEAFFREQLGLPPIPKAVSEAWAEEGGIRRPVTLSQETPPQQGAVAKEAAPDNANNLQ